MTKQEDIRIAVRLPHSLYSAFSIIAHTRHGSLQAALLVMVTDYVNANSLGGAGTGGASTSTWDDQPGMSSITLAGELDDIPRAGPDNNDETEDVS